MKKILTALLLTSSMVSFGNNATNAMGSGSEYLPIIVLIVSVLLTALVYLKAKQKKVLYALMTLVLSVSLGLLIIIFVLMF